MTFKREPLRKRAGSRFHDAVGIIASVLAGAALTACVSHYQPSILPLPVSEGWVQLPTARWLTDTGIQPGVITFCPLETCGQQVLIARMDLTGKERSVAELIARDPAAFVARARPTDPRNTSRTKRSGRSRTIVKPLNVGHWQGAVVSFESVKGQAKSAHVAVLASSSGAQAQLVMTVAESSEAAEQGARRILE